jgi:hypothetical protein
MAENGINAIATSAIHAIGLRRFINDFLLIDYSLFLRYCTKTQQEYTDLF